MTHLEHNSQKCLQYHFIKIVHFVIYTALCCFTIHVGQTIFPFFLPGMILSLQMPVGTLIGKIVLSVNSSHFNLSEVSERMQLAIEHTVQAATQVRLLLSRPG